MSVLYWAHEAKELDVVSTGLIGKSSRHEFCDFKTSYVPGCVITFAEVRHFQVTKTHFLAATGQAVLGMFLTCRSCKFSRATSSMPASVVSGRFSAAGKEFFQICLRDSFVQLKYTTVT